MSDTPNMDSMEALRQQYPDAVIKPKAERESAPKPRVETLKLKKMQGLNMVGNVRTIRINDAKYPVDKDGDSTMIYNIGVTITSSLDDHDDELEKIQKAVTEFVKNIHNHID